MSEIRRVEMLALHLGDNAMYKAGSKLALAGQTAGNCLQKSIIVG
jgi:hypothetical protein